MKFNVPRPLKATDIEAWSKSTFDIGTAGTRFSGVYANTLNASMWSRGANISIDVGANNVSITASSVVNGGVLDQSGSKIKGLAQATAGSEAVAAQRSLTGGNAIDPIGDLTQDRTIDVSTDGIKEDEIDLSITPTWTGEHTFDLGFEFSDTALATKQGTANADTTGYNSFTLNLETSVWNSARTVESTPIHILKGYATDDTNYGWKIVSEDLTGARIDAITFNRDTNVLGVPNGNLDMSGNRVTNLQQATAGSEAVAGRRTITAGNALSGGGDLTADRTLRVGASSITTDEIDEGITPIWTGEHRFDAGIDVRSDIADSTTTIYDHSSGLLQDVVIPDVETLSYGASFAGTQIPWTGVDRTLDLNDNAIQDTADVTPSTPDTYNIGASGNKYKQIYAHTVVGDLTGDEWSYSGHMGINTQGNNLTVTASSMITESHIIAGSADTYDIGSSGQKFRYIYAHTMVGDMTGDEWTFSGNMIIDAGTYNLSITANSVVSSAHIDLNNNDLIEPDQIRTASTVDTITIRDTYNAQDIVVFNTGGLIEVLSGNVDMGSNKVISLAQATAGSEAVAGRRTISTGAGLSGGGRLTTDRTFSIGAGSVVNSMLANSALTVTAGSHLNNGGLVELGGSVTLDVDDTTIDHDILTNYVPDEHIAHSGVTFSAGNALSGGGDLTSDRTFAVGSGSIQTNEIDLSITPTWTGKHSFDSGFEFSHTALATKQGTADSAVTGYDSYPLKMRTSVWDSAHTVEVTPVHVLKGYATNDTNYGWKVVSGDLAGTLTDAITFNRDTNTLAVPSGNIDMSSNKITDLQQATAGSEAVAARRVISTGAGLSGGGRLTTDRTFSIGAGSVVNSMLANSAITITAGSHLTGGGLTELGGSTTLDVDDTTIDHDVLTNFVPDEHVAHSGVTFTAGNALSGGGDLSADRTFSVGASSITTNEIDEAISPTWTGIHTYSASIHTGTDRGYDIGEAGTRFASVYAASVVADISGDVWTFAGNMTINTQGNNLTVQANSIVSNATLDMQGNKIRDLQQATAGSEAVTGKRSLIGGNAIDSIGDLTQDRTIDVSVNGIATDEIAESISPTWTGLHTFDGNIDMSAGAILDAGTKTVSFDGSQNISILNGYLRNLKKGTADSATTGYDSYPSELETSVWNSARTVEASPVNTLKGYANDDTDYGWKIQSEDLGGASVDVLIFNRSTNILSVPSSDLNMGSNKITALVQASAGSEAVAGGRVITAGSGLSGGGDLTADRRFDVGAGSITNAMLANSSLTVTAGSHLAGGGQIALGGSKTINVEDSTIDHDILTNFVSNEHVAHSSVTLTAGSGLSGGGNISTSRRFDIGAGSVTNLMIKNSNITIHSGTALSGGGLISLGASGTLSVGASSITTREIDEGITPKWVGKHAWESTDTATAGTSYGSYRVEVRNSVWDSAHTVATETHNQLRGYAVDDTNYGWKILSEDLAGSIIDVLIFNRDTNVLSVPNGNLSMGTNKITDLVQATAGSEAVAARRTITAGSHLSGGGDLTTDRTFNVSDETINHDVLTNFVSDEHVAHSSVTITAGSGLVGGGNISSSRKISVGAGSITNSMIENPSLTVNSGDGLVGGGIIDLGGSRTLSIGAGSVVNSMLANSAVTVTAGSHLNNGGLVELGQSVVLDVDDTTIDHDILTNFVSEEHINHGNVSINAGNALTGGGSITSSRTLAVATNGIATDEIAESISPTWTGRHTFGEGFGAGSQSTFKKKGTASAGTSYDSYSSLFKTSVWNTATSAAVTQTNKFKAYANDDTDYGWKILSGDLGGTIIDTITFNRDTNTITVPNGPLDMGGNKISNLQQATATNEAVAGGRLLTAGSGLTGGGDLTSDRRFDVGAGSITNYMIANSSVTVYSGTALSGGGQIELGTSRTLSVGASSITTREIDEGIVPTWTGQHTFNAATAIVMGGYLDMSGDNIEDSAGTLTVNGNAEMPNGNLQLYDDLKQLFGSGGDYSVRYDSGEGKVAIRDESAGKDLCYIS